MAATRGEKTADHAMEEYVYRRFQNELLRKMCGTGEGQVVTRIRRSLFALFVFVMTLIPLWGLNAYAMSCPNHGPDVDVGSRCAFFYYFRQGDGLTDPRIASHLDITEDTPVRSIAVVVGISRYPNVVDADDRDLPAAREDVKQLKAFLTANQSFDEVIVLQDDQATRDNIEYFLRDYPRAQAIKYKGRSRFLFAYSGHGIPRANAATGYLELSGANSSVDSANLFEFDEIKVLLEDLAAKNFHVLALINACYGGGIFGMEIASGALNNPYGKGAYAMTAGPSDSLVYALPGKDAETGDPHGSIFFENLIRGVSTGGADEESKNYPEIEGPSGEIKQSGAGIVRLGALDAWLSGEIDKVNDRTGGNPDTHKRFAYPVLGSVEPFDVPAVGAFFFLQPQQLASTGANVGQGSQVGKPVNHLAQCQAAFVHVQGTPCSCDAKGKNCLGSCVNGYCVSQLALPRTPTSFVPGAPELKVFRAPAAYPVRGVDVSRFEGDIDWKRLRNGHFDFAYIRALAKGLDSQASPEGLDRNFETSWAKAAAAGVYRGAYNVFSYCDSVASQYDTISRAVPAEKDALPIALDIEQYPTSWRSWNKEAQCAADSNIENTRTKVLELAAQLRNRYNKTPVIEGVGSVLSELLDKRFSQYMLWIASYPRGGSSSNPDLKLTGANPWTLWQYTAHATVPGIGNNVNVNAFFGTADQFVDFREGRNNVALMASGKNTQPFGAACTLNNDEGRLCSCDSKGENCGVCRAGICVPSKH